VHLYYLYNEPTNAQLINNLLYCCLLHCPNMFQRYHKYLNAFLKCITNTAFRYLCNLAGSDYELPKDDTIVLKHVGAL